MTGISPIASFARAALPSDVGDEVGNGAGRCEDDHKREAKLRFIRGTPWQASRLVGSCLVRQGLTFGRAGV